MKVSSASDNKYKAIGVMSGTSLDGLDLAAVVFDHSGGKWNFELIHSQTIPYADTWENRLKYAPGLEGQELVRLDAEYGTFLGKKILGFIQQTKFTPDLIASHGHTVFHQPEEDYTLQIGSGANIAAITNTLTVSDFRTGDVALGGHGAPLVPIGDKLLFSENEFCLNLGGFANISFEKENQRLAYDICPVNFVLNHMANKKGMAYDKDGMLGQKGKVDPFLLNELNGLPYYNSTLPKSLGREWVEKEFFPVMDKFEVAFEDKMRTLYEHIAIQIQRSVTKEGKMLITGGGAFNAYLIERISDLCKANVVIPQNDIIDFKEAIIFAFLGVLRITNKNNCLSSVTGASKDSCAGIIHHFA